MYALRLCNIPWNDLLHVAFHSVFFWQWWILFLIWKRCCIANVASNHIHNFIISVTQKKTCAEFLDKNLFRGEIQGHLGEHFHLREHLQRLFLYHQWTRVSAGGLITRWTHTNKCIVQPSRLWSFFLLSC